MKCFSIILAILLCCSSVSAEQLLDFTADWCQPCQQMQPVITAMEQAGYPIARVNVDQRRDLAQRYGITAVPTFVMVDATGKELSRKSGILSAADLVAMFGQRSVGVVIGRDPIDAAVCRVSVPDGDRKTSLGSGALVAVDGEAGLVLTNYHVVKDWDGSTQMAVSFHSHNSDPGYRSAAELIGTDGNWDLAVLRIAAPPDVKPLAIRSTPPQIGESLMIHGWGSGAYLSQSGKLYQYQKRLVSDEQSELIAMQATARSGDSGGPITDARGELAGVLWGSDPRRNMTSGINCGRVQLFLAAQCQSGWGSGGAMRPTIPSNQGVPQYRAPTQSAPPTDLSANFAAIDKRLGDLIAKIEKCCEDEKQTTPAPAIEPITGPAGPIGPPGKDAQIDYDQLASALVKQLPPIRIVYEGGTGQADRKLEIPLGGDIRLPAIAVERWGIDANGANVKLDAEKYRLDTPLKLRYGVPTEAK